MITREQLRVLESLGTQGIREIKKVGGSYYLLLPKSWVEVNTLEIQDGELSYWMQLEVQSNGSLVFKYPDLSDLEEELKLIRAKESKR